MIIWISKKYIKFSPFLSKCGYKENKLIIGKLSICMWFLGPYSGDRDGRGEYSWEGKREARKKVKYKESELGMESWREGGRHTGGGSPDSPRASPCPWTCRAAPWLRSPAWQCLRAEPQCLPGSVWLAGSPWWSVGRWDMLNCSSCICVTSLLAYRPKNNCSSDICVPFCQYSI